MTAPRGFRESNAGLLVPEAISREREVWCKDEWRLLDRATRLLTSRGIKFQFACAHPRCHGERMTLTRDKTSGDVVLQCAHKTRVATRAF